MSPLCAADSMRRAASESASAPTLALEDFSVSAAWLSRLACYRATLSCSWVTSLAASPLKIDPGECWYGPCPVL